MTRRLKFLLVLATSVPLLAAAALALQASSIPTSQLINPEDLVQILQSKSEKPLMFQVGSHVLFAQAHIPGSEYRPRPAPQARSLAAA